MTRHPPYWARIYRLGREHISKEVGKVVLVVLHFFPQYFAAMHVFFMLCNAFFLFLFQTTECAPVNAVAL